MLYHKIVIVIIKTVCKTFSKCWKTILASEDGVVIVALAVTGFAFP